MFLAAAVVAIGLYVWLRPRPEDPTRLDFAQVDKLQQELAARVGERFGEAPDFRVIVTGAEYRIGTLMRLDPSSGDAAGKPGNYNACLPDAPPPPIPTPSLFPSGTVSAAAAVSIGGQVVKEVAAQLRMGADSRINVSVEEAEAEMLAEDDIDDLVGRPACRAALLRKPFLLVRGYITGQRTFTFDIADRASADVKFGTVGSLEVAPSANGRLVEIRDKKRTKFLQILTQVSLPNPAAASVEIAKPALNVVTGRIYLQRDRSDTTQKPRGVLESLRAAGLSVVSQIEAIDSAKMPSAPEVRFFNRGDETKAQRVAEAVRGSYPGVRTKLVAIPAPPGQVEVWMPAEASQAPPEG